MVTGDATAEATWRKPGAIAEMVLVPEPWGRIATPPGSRIRRRVGAPTGTCAVSVSWVTGPFTIRVDAPLGSLSWKVTMRATRRPGTDRLELNQPRR
mgnify:CR=1 FL=1